MNKTAQFILQLTRDLAVQDQWAVPESDAITVLLTEDARKIHSTVARQLGCHPDPVARFTRCRAQDLDVEIETSRNCTSIRVVSALAWAC